MSVWTNVLTGMVIPVVIAGTGWYISDQQSEQAKVQQNIDRAVAKVQQDADRVAVLLPSLASQNPKEKGLAFALVGYYKSKGQLPDEVHSLLTQVWVPELERTGDKESPTQVRKGQDISAAEEKVANLLPRVYLHIVDEGQRYIAEKFEDGLEKIGFIVPGIQKVDKGPIFSPELRYFRKQGKEPEEAEKVAEKLKELGLSNVDAKYIPGYENAKIRPRHYELWFSHDSK